MSRTWRRAVVVMTLWGVCLAGATTHARSLVSELPTAAELRSQQLLLLESSLAKRRTLQYSKLEDLITEVAGRPRLPAYIKFRGNFRSYWRASQNSFAGKSFEAIVAFQENQRRESAGQVNRLLVTAAEGLKHDAADLVDVTPAGRVVGRYQAKLGVEAAVNAISDPKYFGMVVLTTPKSLDQIRTDTARAQWTAGRRVISLDPQTRVLLNAIDTGRLTDRIVGGATSPSRRIATRLVRYPAADAWREYNRLFMGTGQLTRLGQVLSDQRVIAGGLVVLDLGATGYFTWVDWGRYQTGEVSGRYLAYKTSLRAAQASLAVYAVTTPEPLSKALSAVAASGLALTDALSEPIYSAWQSRRSHTAEMMLAALEHDERLLAVRAKLRSELLR